MLSVPLTYSPSDEINQLYEVIGNPPGTSMVIVSWAQKIVSVVLVSTEERFENSVVSPRQLLLLVNNALGSG